jgi:hypothetical protein
MTVVRRPADSPEMPARRALDSFDDDEWVFIKEHPIYLPPGHEADFRYRGEIVELWCPCTPDGPIRVWGDEDDDPATKNYLTPHAAEVNRVISEHMRLDDEGGGSDGAA